MSAKLNNNELKAIGLHELPLLKEAGSVAKHLIRQGTYTKEEVLALLKDLRYHPNNYLTHEHFAELARQVNELLPAWALKQQAEAGFALHDAPIPYVIYGREGIEAGALQQMDVACRLPVAVAGALMPDAHHGYGLPIGGVLATTANTVIPYAVGVDIACRMCLSVWDVPAAYLEKNKSRLRQMLLDHTYFGLDSRNTDQLPDEVFDHPDWKATPGIRYLRPKAEAQLGTSGTGNHFVEWGTLDITAPSPELPLPVGTYLALLSHSGSRGFGATIAGQYSKLAMEKTKLPKEAQHLAWLDLDTEAGQEYWIAMNLAGHYASANHHQIHRRLAKALDKQPVKLIENHHNFAWAETLPDGTPVIVHRKGATPAAVGELGIIPGSMAQPGFVVRGKGAADALASASHGAGRLMSRSKALQTLRRKEVEQHLAEAGITLLGGDLDEAPMVYKDIHGVIAAQQDLVDVLAKFQPVVVRMADPDRRQRW